MARWLLASIALAASGCTVDVQVGFGTCGDHDAGDSWTETGAGCDQQCSCDGDGTPTCVPPICEPPIVTPPVTPTCTWPEEGLTLGVADSQVSADGCRTCTCLDTGELSCTTDPCCLEPTCEPMNPMGSCYSMPISCEAGVWRCADICECPADTQPVCPMAPLGCSWLGPTCDYNTGYWSDCGELVCTGCTGMGTDMCGDPMIPGCYYEAVCVQGAYFDCKLVCDGCVDPPISCVPQQPECTSEPVCGPMGWDCDEQCPCDPGMMGPCDPDMCSTAEPVCLEQDWYCANICG